MLPALAKAGSKSRATRCSSNMKNWAGATHMYLTDFDDRLPFFGDLSSDNTQPFWHSKLAPYLSKRNAPANAFYGQNEVFADEIRRCPGGQFAPPPYFKGKESSKSWNTWIGANFGGLGQPLTAPFFYGDVRSPLSVNCISRPAEAMLYMDSLTHVIYNPVQERFRFTLDLDGDGTADTMAAYPDVPFNYARPTIHNNGANVTLLDGHVERVAFKKLWNVNASNKVTHPFWYLNQSN
jgi:prepilin-type processing-associated H-X9-DG protein